MKDGNEKNPAQLMLTKNEFYVVKLAAISRGFRSVNQYLKSVVEKDVVMLKKEAVAPWTLGGPGMTKSDWDELSETERERFMNQIGPVKPASLDYFLKMKKEGPSPMDVGFRQDNDLI